MKIQRFTSDAKHGTDSVVDYPRKDGESVYFSEVLALAGGCQCELCQAVRAAQNLTNEPPSQIKSGHLEEQIDEIFCSFLERAHCNCAPGICTGTFPATMCRKRMVSETINIHLTQTMEAIKEVIEISLFFDEKKRFDEWHAEEVKDWAQMIAEQIRSRL